MAFQDSNEMIRTSASRFRLVSVSLLAGVFIISLIAGFILLNRQTAPLINSAAPNFRVTTYDGQQIALADLRGKVVLLNFWGTWCGPCREETQELQQLHEQYEGQGVVVLGVTYRDHPEDAMAFIEEHNLSYLNAPDSDIADGKYRIQGAPESFIIDPQGNIAFTYKGPVTLSMLTPVLDELLSDPA